MGPCEGPHAVVVETVVLAEIYDVEANGVAFAGVGHGEKIPDRMFV